MMAIRKIHTGKFQNNYVQRKYNQIGRLLTKEGGQPKDIKSFIGEVLSANSVQVTNITEEKHYLPCPKVIKDLYKDVKIYAKSIVGNFKNPADFRISTNPWD